MRKEDKNKKRSAVDSLIVALIVLVIVAGGAGVLWSILNNRKESYISSSITTKINYLDCTATKAQDAFFVSDKSNSSSHKIKIAFSGGNLQKATYTYNGTFPSEEIARTEIDAMQAKLFTYMGKIGLGATDLTPGFSVNFTKGTVNVFIDTEFLNTSTAKIIFLDEKDISRLEDKDANVELEKIYKNKGFTCRNAD